jgi:hypothetical protein
MPLAPDQSAALVAAANAALAPVEADRDAARADAAAQAARVADLTAEVARLRALPPAVVVRAPLSVGLCLEEVTDYSTSAMFANVALYFSGWGKADKPWEPNPTLQLTADGYPTSPDVGCYTYATGYAAGDYAFRMDGSGVPAFSGRGRFVAAPVRDGNVVTGTVRLGPEANAKGESVGPLKFAVAGIDPANPPRNFRLIVPGLPTDTPRVTNPAFAAAVAPFGGPLRVGVGPQRINVEGGRIRDWPERVTPDQFPQTTTKGVALEYLIAVANECGKDLWLSVPVGASDAFHARLADLLAARLNPNRLCWAEVGNELWNNRLGSWRPNFDAAQVNPELTDADPNIRAWQQTGFAARRLALALKPKLGDRVRVVLGGQASFAWNSADHKAPGPAETALDFLAAKYPEPPSSYLYGLAIACYRDAGDDTSTADKIFAGLDAALANQTLRDKDARHRAVATKYGVKLLAYESAVTVRGKQAAPDPRDAVQSDPRIGDRVTGLLSYAESAGFDGVEYYYAVGKVDGQSEGRYPLARDLPSFATSPKAQAARAFAAARN